LKDSFRKFNCGAQIKVEYQGYRVKVDVTSAISVSVSCSRVICLQLKNNFVVVVVIVVVVIIIEN